MQAIHYIIRFFNIQDKKLVMNITAKYQDKVIDLRLASFLTFLYENEKNLAKNDIDMCYGLAKWVKKVKVENQFIDAITEDFDMAYFFQKAIEYGSLLFWNNDDVALPIQINTILPLTVLVTQEKQNINCQLLNWDSLKNDPFYFLMFSTEKDVYYFSNGVLLANPDEILVNFIDSFLDTDKVRFNDSKAEYFILKIYRPNQNKLYWDMRADLSAFLPIEITPLPLLDLNYDNVQLTTTLFYQYADVLIDSEYADDIVFDPKTGKKYLRQADLEAIYQQDLMSLFTEFKLPFLLQSPKDISEFLAKIVPVLKEREWIIKSNIGSLEIAKEPLELNFGLSGARDSSNIDWFYFEPNVDVMGQKISCQELMRLMIQNKGYLKTKKGFVQISEKSQKELELLEKFKAFNPSRKFNKADILPLISVSAVTSNHKETKNFIENIKNFEKLSKCVPAESFQGSLRDYQQAGLNWMNFLYHTGFGGILADDMGLGKTVQVIAFTSQLPKEGPFLVIGPTNVIYNWEAEIKKFDPQKKVLIYSGSNRVNMLEKLDKTDFIITSYGVLKNDIDWLSSINFHGVFVDEAQYIKNPQAQVSKAVKQLKGRFKLVLTGTPIENHIQDLWNLFDFIMPDFLGNKRHFDLLLADNHQHILKTKIKPFVLRRIKQEVLDSLPEKTEIVLHCKMSEAQKTLYETVLQAVKVGIKNSSGQRERLNILTSLLKLRQVCVHPGLLSEFQTQNIESTKFELAKDIILDLMEEKHKVTIFSQFTGVLDLLQTWIEENKFYFERIDGAVSGKNRQDAVRRFQAKDEAGVFLISLKAGGVGINLTSADYVIHIDPWWNPAAESQATDRVHRMGQKNKVIVYKLITEGTIEDKIQELQVKKRALLAEMIDIDSMEDKEINIDELRKLLV